MKLVRRRFNRMIAVLLAAALVPVDWLKAEAKKVAFNLSKIKKLQKVGGWAILKIKSRHILFVRDTKDSIKALDSTCTHKKCTVEYDSDSKRVVCPCHGSTFDLNGKVLSPPASRPLKSFLVTLKDGRVTLTLEDQE